LATAVRRGIDSRGKIARLYALLTAANVIAWVWALAAFQAYPLLLGTALLAYGLGLRHAVDADHIAAIDNVTRRLMHDGQRSVAVGFFFALGHSTFVTAAAIVIAATAGTLLHSSPGIVEAGGVIGTAISALFLFAIAGANATVFAGLWRLFRQVKRGGSDDARQLGPAAAGCSLFGNLLGRVLRLVSRSWHMYPLGMLFALGFDTASEIGVLGIAAAEAVKGMPIWSILVFPALFTAGMTLIDTTDGVLMLGAYSWAFADPRRTLVYNLTMTGLSVAVALLVGAIEVLGLTAEHLGVAAGFRGVLALASENLGTIGGIIVASFAATWIVSLVIGRMRTV
jgi:nickel/cobalt transporter (NiCoT) family protein